MILFMIFKAHYKEDPGKAHRQTIQNYPEGSMLLSYLILDVDIGKQNYSVWESMINIWVNINMLMKVKMYH